MRLLPIYALLFFSTGASASEPAKLQQRFASLLPPGWEVATEGTEVVVSRAAEASFYNPLGLRSLSEEYLDSITQKMKVTFRFRLADLPSEEDAGITRDAVHRATQQIAAMEALLVPLRYKISFNTALNDDEGLQKTFQDYLKLLQNTKLPDVPDGSFEGKAVFISAAPIPTHPWVQRFRKESEHYECLGVLTLLLSVIEAPVSDREDGQMFRSEFDVPPRGTTTPERIMHGWRYGDLHRGKLQIYDLTEPKR